MQSTVQRPTRDALQSDSYRGWLIVFVFICSFCVFGARNLDPLTFPTIYAEDGVWTSQILTHGFFETAFRGRNFPVFGVVSFDQLALWLSSALPGGLLRLPLALFVICNGFMAFTATVVLCGLRRHVPFLVRFAMWAAVVLMPVGSDGNEIFGRALNLGFAFPVLQMFLLAEMMCDPDSRAKSALALVVALLAGWSFPVCIGMNGIALVLMCRRSKKGLPIALPWQGWVLLAVLLADVLSLQPSSITSKGGADLPYTPAGLIEFALARVMLFPLVALVYRHLSDPLVLLIALAGAVCMGAVLPKLRQRNGLERRIVLLFLGSFFMYAAATIVMRKGFTNLLPGNYAETFPDRYFFGVNAMAVCAMLILLRYTVKATWWKACAWFWIVLFFIGMVTDHRVIELSHPTNSWRSHGTFRDELCASAIGKGKVPANFNGPFTTVATYPDLPDNGSWTMDLPTSFVKKLADSKYCGKQQ